MPNEIRIARVGVLGYGVIGRRLATAVTLQPDMHLVGVAGRQGSHALAAARRSGLRTIEIDSADPAMLTTEFGTFLSDLDVLLDCTPSGVPQQYRRHLEQLPELITIVQGGELPESCDVSFNSLANFAAAAGQKRIRVISCSSTGTTRFLWAVQRRVGVADAFVTLIRRAADPGKLSKVPTNSLVPTMGISHHARDVNSVMPEARILSVSVDCPTTFSHILWFHLELSRPSSKDEILAALACVPRILVGSGIAGTAELAEHFTDLRRYRHDHPELYVFAETLAVRGCLLTAAVSVHMESITIPETIDCIRAAMGLEADPWKSMQVTDGSLGIVHPDKAFVSQG